MSRTEIVNLALREIGTFRVDDWTDDAPEADVARDVWDQARRMTLSRHEWHFAKAFRQLARSAETPAARWTYYYTLPADCLRTCIVSARAGLDDEFTGYDITEQGVATDATAIFIEYIRDHTTEGTWPAWFVSVMVADLASLMASPLKSETARERLEKLAMSRLAQARSLDSQQAPVKAFPVGSWVSAARGARWR